MSRSLADLSAELGHYRRLVHEEAAALAYYKKMYDRASTLARIGVWECELATESLTWTDGVYDLFELPRGSHVDRPMILALYEEDSRRTMERLRSEAIRTGRSFTLDIRVRTSRGTPRWLRLTCDVEMENGRAARIFGAKQDITEMRQAQEEVQALQAELLQQSQRKAVGATVATLAHDLNQPLTAIVNHAAGARRLMNREASDRAQLEEGLDAIANNAMRAGLLIRRMRELTAGSRPERRPIRLVALVREAAARALRESGQDIHIEDRLVDDALLLVDPLQFGQVVVSLVRNACQALVGMPRREIILATTHRPGRIELSVEDSGPGFGPGMRERAFDSLATTRPGHLGMGLALCRTIVEAHGGEIWAKDGNGGARLCVAMPVYSAA